MRITDQGVEYASLEDLEAARKKRALQEWQEALEVQVMYSTIEFVTFSEEV